MPIKLLLLAGILLLAGYALRHRNGTGFRAGMKLLAVGFAAVAAVSIVDPGVTQTLATWVGVRRGTDLVLYLLVIAFLAVSVNQYFRYREVQQKLVALVRAAAIRDAVRDAETPVDADCVIGEWRD